MEYTVKVWYEDRVLLEQTANLPTCMQLLSVALCAQWTRAHMVSQQTGEVIARWENNSEYGVTTF